MSDESATPHDRGRRLRLMPVVLVVALVSYTVFRLQHLSQNLPYEPGPPLPVTTVTETGGAPLAAELREAFLAKRSAAMPGEAGARYACWPLAGIERERARRFVTALRTEQPGPLTDALGELVEADEAFVLEAEPLPDEADGWRYWRKELFAVRERRRVLFVPVDTARFPGAR